MRKPALTLLASLLLTIAVAGSIVPANDSSTQEAPVAVPVATAPDADFVVHEWGTFTTFSGSDGLFLDFRPLATEHSDLPPFVLDRASKSPLSLFTKARLRGRVRMETPVTYFYSDRIRTVNVSVDFPEGLLTEFYPPVKEMLPAFDPKAAFNEGEPVGNSRLDWGQITVIPIDALVPGIADAQQRSELSRSIADRVLPTAANDHHYAQARATDSALVHIRGSNRATANGSKGPEEDFLEKFLFYRGVGNFTLPVTATFDGQGQATFSNHGRHAINSAILIEVHDESIQAATIEDIAPGESINLGAAATLSPQSLQTIVEDALVREGLFPKEASSMVQTWQQSWFTEPGTRVLYTVPEPTTDDLLPLQIDPQPSETLRVLIGRMELITPEMEQRWLGVVRSSSQARADFKAQNAEQGDQRRIFPVPEVIRQFGRLAEPALVRVAKIASDEEARVEAQRLLDQLRTVPAETPPGDAGSPGQAAG